jgi:hypothetical protein
VFSRHRVAAIEGSRMSPSASSYESKLPTSSIETASIDKIYHFSTKSARFACVCAFFVVLRTSALALIHPLKMPSQSKPIPP